MKAQMTIEFIIAAVVFFSIVLYVVVYLNSGLSEYREDFSVNDLQSRVIQISDFLVHDRVVGVSGGYPVLSTARIDSLNRSCNDDYPELLSMLDLKHRRIRVEINNTETGEVLMDCLEGFVMPKKATKVSMMRFGVLDASGETAVMSLWVW